MSRLVPVTEVVRSGRIESVHLGAAVVADRTGRVCTAAGDPSTSAYLRSAAKPVQLLTMLELGLERRFELEPAELAVCAASHGGEPGHVQTVRALLGRAGLDESSLRCGPLPPLDPDARAAAASGGGVLQVHNNCSGKHAAMLITCANNGWELEGYCAPDHPLQRAIRARVGELCGRHPEVGVDGCGVPTFFMDLAAAARMTAELTALAEEGGDANRVVKAMTGCPWYTSGSRRLAYLVMAAAPGLLAKEGAEGLFVVGIPAVRSRWGEAVALAVKVLDGAGEDARGRDPGVVTALASIGALSSAESDALAAASAPAMRTASGRPVGVVRGVLRLPATPGQPSSFAPS